MMQVKEEWFVTFHENMLIVAWNTRYMDLKCKLNVGDQEVHGKGPSIVSWHVLNQKLQCFPLFPFFTPYLVALFEFKLGEG